MIIPEGSSPGAMQILAKVSEINKSTAPKIMLNGKSVFAFGPKSFRVMCGAINPTKLIVPPAHTAALTASEPEIKTRVLNLSTSTPRLFAEVSPPERRSSGGTAVNIRITERIETGRIKINSFHPRPLKLPRIHV